MPSKKQNMEDEAMNALLGHPMNVGAGAVVSGGAGLTGGGSTPQDSSGHGRNAVFVNTPTWDAGPPVSLGAPEGLEELNFLEVVASRDLNVTDRKNREYSGSWKKRGGVGAFMMLARKWDRLEPAAAKHGYDIFSAIENDDREEGIIDDIRDLRRYLMLVEAWMTARGVVK